MIARNISLIIAGSRGLSPSIEDIDDALLACPVWPSLVPIREVVSGEARGVDRAGAAWAEARGIPVHREPVTADDYETYGRYLGPKMRNRRMADRANAALVFWDGESGGSADMVCRMVARGKLVHVVPWRGAR